MNTKILGGNFLIPVVFLIVFLSMTVNLALAGTARCSILPGDPAISDEYCPTCPVAKARCDHKPTPGISACSCADTWCAGWINNNTCDWIEGVHICKAVCKDAANMPICSQVAAYGATLGWGWLPSFPIIFQDYIPIGGCCNYDQECQVRGKYPERRCQREQFECSQVINSRIYPGYACCSLTGYYCEKSEHCCSLSDICVNGTCQPSGQTCTSTDPPYPPTSPYGNDPFYPGSTTCPGGSCEDTCISGISGTRLDECYCVKNDPFCKHETIDCNKICSPNLGECKMDINGRGYCYCITTPPTTTYPTNYTWGGGGCPTLFVYDGKEYLKERKTGIHSQEGIDTVDDIVLKTNPAVVDGNYILLLKETTLPEHSYIDSVKLYVVDSEGKKEAKLLTAKHSRYGDVTGALVKSDDIRTDTKVFDNIELKFEAPKLKGAVSDFTFKIEGYNPAREITGLVVRPGIYKLDIASLSLIIVIAAVIIIVIIYGAFKLFAKKK